MQCGDKRDILTDVPFLLETNSDSRCRSSNEKPIGKSDCFSMICQNILNVAFARGNRIRIEKFVGTIRGDANFFHNQYFTEIDSIANFWRRTQLRRLYFLACKRVIPSRTVITKSDMESLRGNLATSKYVLMSCCPKWRHL